MKILFSAILVLFALAEFSNAGTPAYEEGPLGRPLDGSFPNTPYCIECAAVVQGNRMPDDCNSCIGGPGRRQGKKYVTNGKVKGCCRGEGPKGVPKGWTLSEY